MEEQFEVIQAAWYFVLPVLGTVATLVGGAVGWFWFAHATTLKEQIVTQTSRANWLKERLEIENADLEKKLGAVTEQLESVSRETKLSPEDGKVLEASISQLKQSNAALAQAISSFKSASVAESGSYVVTGLPLSGPGTTGK